MGQIVAFFLRLSDGFKTFEMTEAVPAPMCAQQAVQAMKRFDIVGLIITASQLPKKSLPARTALHCSLHQQPPLVSIFYFSFHPLLITNPFPVQSLFSLGISLTGSPLGY